MGSHNLAFRRNASANIKQLEIWENNRRHDSDTMEKLAESITIQFRLKRMVEIAHARENAHFRSSKMIINAKITIVNV